MNVNVVGALVCGCVWVCGYEREGVVGAHVGVHMLYGFVHAST